MRRNSGWVLYVNLAVSRASTYKSLTIPKKVLTEDSARECGQKAGPWPGEERDAAVSDRDGGLGLTLGPERVELDLRLWPAPRVGGMSYSVA